MDNLHDQDTLEDLNEELRSDILPHGIDQAYVEINCWLLNTKYSHVIQFSDIPVCLSELARHAQ